MAMKWRTWSSVSEGSSAPGAPITAIPYGDRIAVFLADPGGGIYFTAGHPDRGWNGWAPIPNLLTTPGATVTACPSGDQIALVVANAGGEVFAAAGTPDSGWNAWHTAAQGSTRPGAPVCAVPYGPRIALFLADPGGGVYDTAGYPQQSAFGGDWRPMPNLLTTPGAKVTACPSGDKIAVFVTNANGEVFSAAGTPDSGWSGWHTAAQGSTPPGAPVCAVPFGERFALFLSDPNGGIYATAGYPNHDSWGGSWSTVSEGRSNPGAPVTAIPYGDGFAVFIADPNGGVYYTLGNPDAGWQGWALIDGVYTAPGAHISVVPFGARLALFMTDQKGEVFSTSIPPLLRKVEIRFDTHNDNKDGDTLVNVFVKNRLNNSLTPEPTTDYLANYLTLKRFLPYGDLIQGERNPYLAYGHTLGEFDDPSSNTLALQLVSDDISVDEVVLPQVDIHILAKGNDRWIFDYTVTLFFDNGPLSFTSAVDGVHGIILDQDNRNYSGIGVENGLRMLPIPQLPKPATNALLKKVTLRLSMHNDNKNWDTRLNVHIVNRLGATTAQDLAIGLDLLHGQEFPDNTDVSLEFNWSDDQTSLASETIQLADIVLPIVYLAIVPNGNDRWIFDYTVSFEFVDPQNFNEKPTVFSSETKGVILDQDNNKHAGPYQGDPFPTVTPSTAPRLTNRPIDHTGNNHKVISIPFLRKKFDEFVNNRDDLSLIKLWGGSTFDYPLPGISGGTPPPETYFDLQSLINGDDGMTHYTHNLTSFGQLDWVGGDVKVFLSNIESQKMQVSIDPLSPTPITLSTDFGPGVINIPTRDINIDRASIAIDFTLEKKVLTDQFAKQYTVVDLMSWVDELKNMKQESLPEGFYGYTGTFLHQPVINVITKDSLNDYFVEQVIKVSVTSNWLGKTASHYLRDKIYSKLSGSGRDAINSQATSWLLGGVADDFQNRDENNAWINEVGIQNANPEFGIPEDSIIIDYTGPKNVFVPAIPPDWPTSDFSPSTLKNINHIVVLTMENRSFDHMLGYLSLPVEQGGMGRSDVDGLKGNEFNPYNGRNYPVFPLSATRFVPGPPNGYESVHRAINGGKMDGFVKSYAEENTDEVAGQVMGYHTATTVPVYDALTRDFAIGHRWFASHPGSTFPNRFYELTGRPNLDARGFWEFGNSSPILPSFTPTIFDYLEGATDPISGGPVTWRYFEYGYCTLRFFEHHTFRGDNIVDFYDQQNGFFACAESGRLPSVSFIDPHFVDFPSGSNDDEPPSDVAYGQAFVKTVVEAISASPAWDQTLLLIVYDEHGGFYDHVAPPEAPRVSDDFPIATSGLRVPAFAISPWVAAGSVFGHDGDLTNPVPPVLTGGASSSARRRPVAGQALHFDHTSILKTIARRFLSNNPPYLGARYAAANDLSMVLGDTLREQQFRPFIPYRFQFLGSGMMLDVQGADPAPGTLLWQFGPNGTNAQDFSFEEPAGGFVYIRSHVSHLYLTIKMADPNIPSSPQVIQDVKYSSSAGATVPDGQLWKLVQVGADGQGGALYEISGKAYPNLRLRPVDPAAFESTITLVDPGVTSGDVRWRVQSPKIG